MRITIQHVATYALLRVRGALGVVTCQRQTAAVVAVAVIAGAVGAAGVALVQSAGHGEGEGGEDADEDDRGAHLDVEVAIGGR